MRRHTSGDPLKFVEGSNNINIEKPKLIKKKIEKPKCQKQSTETEKILPETSSLEINFNDVTNILTIDSQLRFLLKNDPSTLEKYVNATNSIICSWHLSVPPSPDLNIEIKKDSKADELKKIYLEQAQISGKIKVREPEIDPYVCTQCDGEMQDRTDLSGMYCSCGNSVSKLVCGDVGNQNGIVVESGPTTQRNIQDRLQHLDNLIDILQGIEDFTIPKDSLIKLRKRIANIDNLDRSKLLSILEAEKSKEFKSLIDHLANVYRKLTGKEIPIIIDNTLRDRIRARHVEFLICYHDWKIRINSKETRLFKATYLLWQYLSMEGKQLNLRVDMPSLKLKDTLDWHNQTMRTICNQLNEKPDTKFVWKAFNFYS